jgi:hypothetical protein
MAHYKPTKAEHQGSAIFSSGDKQTLQHLLTSLANNAFFYAFISQSLAAILSPEQSTFPMAFAFFQKLFDLFRRPQAREFFSANVTEIPHLVHTIHCDIHITLTLLYRFATNPTNIQHVKNGDHHLVDFNTITDFLDSSNTLLADLRRMINNGNISSTYLHPPSTYVPFPQATPHRRDQPPATPPARPAQRHAQRFDPEVKRAKSNSPQGAGSDPTKGWVCLTPGSTYPAPPPLEGGSACFNFITKGQSCPHGRNCKFRHLTYPNLGLPANTPRADLWIHSNANLSFAAGFGPDAAPAPARRPNGTN